MTTHLPAPSRKPTIDEWIDEQERQMSLSRYQKLLGRCHRYDDEETVVEWARQTVRLSASVCLPYQITTYHGTYTMDSLSDPAPIKSIDAILRIDTKTGLTVYDRDRDGTPVPAHMLGSVLAWYSDRETYEALGVYQTDDEEDDREYDQGSISGSFTVANSGAVGSRKS